MRWGRILLGGLLAELLIFLGEALVLAVWGENATLYSAAVWSFLLTPVGAYWAARKAASRFVLHGALVGLTATALFFLISWGAPQPIEYWIAHALKVLGGALGGLRAKPRRAD